ncbi:SUL1 Sulfate permease and related transporters (MFS superfamily) [Candidatus Nanopelagicaceae bacterium]
MKLFERGDFPHTRKDFVADVIAGVTVAIVALPLAIGFGITSGLSATSGIATAIVAGFIAALLGGSRFQVSGPTGAMTVVLIPVISKHGVSAIPILGIMAAAVLLLMAVLRLGKFIKHVPEPVVEGFTVGIALLIMLQQFPYALGVAKGEGDRTVISAIHTVRDALSSGLKWQTISVVAITLLIKFNIVKILERFHIKPYVPASFSALAITSLIVVVFNFDVARIGDIPRNVITWAPPSLSGIDFAGLLMPALSIALLAAIEALLAARVADDLANIPADKEFKPNQELMGQGLATIASSFVGGMPSTGAIARTSVNVRSHANSRIAAMIHALVLLIITLFLAPVFSQIPTAAIAGVLIGTSFRIFNKATMLEIFSSSKSNIAIFLVTAVVTLGVDLIWGIIAGVASYLVLKKFSK